MSKRWFEQGCIYFAGLREAGEEGGGMDRTFYLDDDKMVSAGGRDILSHLTN